jgi:hypothetical protein
MHSPEPFELPITPFFCTAWCSCGCARAPMFRPLLPESPTVRAAARRSSPSTPWKASSCVFVFLDLHAIPVPAAFMTPHIYPSMVTRGCAEVQRRGPIWVIPVREDLSFGGFCMRTPENTYLLRASVNRDRLTAVLPSHMLASEYTARIDRGCNRAQDSASTIILSLPAKLIGRDLAGFRRTP